MNLPLPPGAGDVAALAAFDEIVAPAAARFQPDIVLVSAGYDAHWRDPLAGLNYRTVGSRIVWPGEHGARAATPPTLDALKPSSLCETCV